MVQILVEERRDRRVIVGFSRPKNHKFPIFSWAIRVAERRAFSHVYIRWHSRYADADVAYQASGTQVHFLGSKIFAKKIRPIEEYETMVTRDQYQQLLKFCMENAGVDYGYKGIIGIAAVKAMNWYHEMRKTDHKHSNPFSSGETSQWCSKLIGALLTAIGKLNMTDQKTLEIAGPSHINQVIRNHIDFRRIL